ncbi:UDP-GalNAc:beta-1,3-N-acetylgalactosaminyltransferase 2 isoform X2 [Dermacentor silvarum]|uniref:UDP-GalNAc:beta-1, 3-N-acetylgalactosaminyltransferase 2 isoform X2 n=1 Tax=Dermacentor silvarum TaxID=543639 RepID=UPI002101A10B|nr:UDP-GalNAc:beta-1,3-N-acetylgalactosaminyltransferase 2 isoform X2 [Dermacentor silvarum]
MPMNPRTVGWVCLALVVQALLYLYFTRRTILLVGVLSARENFDRRAAARETWLSGASRVKSFFIVGRDACRVPPEDRVDPYVCQRWEPNLTEINENLEFYAATAKTRDCFPRKRPLYTGFSFEVHHPLSVSRLGVLGDILSGSTGVTVALIDAHTREILRKAVISTETGTEDGGYYYRNIDRVILNKYFEGVVSLSGEIVSETCSTPLAWNNGSNLLTYERLYVDHEDRNSVVWTPMAVSGVGIHFVVSDALPSLLDHMDDAEMRQAVWDELVEEEQRKLDAEARRYRDIALVPITDVYRNLPHKLLHFFDFLLQRSIEFDFLVKADDDSLVDLEGIRNSVPQGKHEKIWWSTFRENWPVIRYGKWGESTYSCPLQCASVPCLRMWCCICSVKRCSPLARQE